MSEDLEKIKEWKYNFAWKQLENAQKCNEELDNKAMNNVNFSSLIIPIITGILLYVSNKPIVRSWFDVFMIESLVFFIISIFFAFVALWLRDQGVIETIQQFKAIDKIDKLDYMKIVGGTSQDLAVWQKIVVDAGDDKIKHLRISGLFFAFALLLIFAGGICILFI